MEYAIPLGALILAAAAFLYKLFGDYVKQLGRRLDDCDTHRKEQAAQILLLQHEMATLRQENFNLMHQVLQLQERRG